MTDSTGVSLDIGFFGHFTTQLIITLDYSAFANLHTLQFTKAHAKSFPTRSVFTSSFLVTASNNDYSSASLLKPSLNGSKPRLALHSSAQTTYKTQLFHCCPNQIQGNVTVREGVTQQRSLILAY
jgi:hypothetical protein